jgi:hypothetical protein
MDNKERLDKATQALKVMLAAFLVENDLENYDKDYKVYAMSINTQVEQLVYEIDKQLSYL